MKERPIIFSGPMVRAILGGRKTQTRRACKPMNAWVDQECREVRQHEGAPHHFLKGATMPVERLRCPYGVPGDRLWVREAWRVFGGREYEYQQGRETVIYREGAELVDSVQGPWRPSIHMPRWASRITLEILSVRVERVQEISEEDALAEGALEFDSPTTFVDHGMQSIYLPSMGYARASFMRLWDSINAKRAPWESNPWVWAIEFRRIDA